MVRLNSSGHSNKEGINLRKNPIPVHASRCRRPDCVTILNPPRGELHPSVSVGSGGNPASVSISWIQKNTGATALAFDLIML